MKKFTRYVALILVPTLCIINAPILGRYICLSSNAARDVYDIVTKSDQCHSTARVILLGDSACRQVFGRKDRGDTLNLAENQAYELAGNYLLLRNLLSNNHRYQEVKLLFNPFSLTNNLNQIYSYNYFIKPFRPYLEHLDLVDQLYIDRTFPHPSPFDFLPMIKFHFSNWELPTSHTAGPKISPSNLTYLKKIIQLCQDNQLKFSFGSPPIKLSRKIEVESIRDSSIEEVNRISELARYFASIRYLPDDLFIDDIHYFHPQNITLR